MSSVRHGRRTSIGVAWAIAMTGCGGSVPVASEAGTIPTVSVRPASSAPSSTPAASQVPLPALELLWEASGPTQPTPCCQTWWPAIDPKSGNVWVANSFASEYWIFKPDGAFVEAWGKPGSGDGEFNFRSHRAKPQATGAIAFAPDGSFFVADDGNRRVVKFSADRKLLSQWGGFGAGDGKFAEPFGIATDGHAVYVADDDRGDIQAFDLDGQFVRTFGSITTQAGIFIAVDAAGNLYRSGEEPATVAKYDSSGQLLGRVDVGPADGIVVGLAFGSSGHLFAAVHFDERSRQEIVELDASGRELHRWAAAGETVVVDPSGDAIYVASDGHDGWPTASLRKYALPGD